MIPSTRRFLDNHVLTFVLMLQIIFSQTHMSMGFIIPKISSNAKSDIPSDISAENFPIYSREYVDDTKRKLCILEKVFGNSESLNHQCDDLKAISESEIIKEAYNYYCNDELKNFDKILNFIEKQPKKDIKDLAYNMLYQEVLDHYMLEKSETNQMNLCLLEIILEKKQEAIGHFKDLNPSSVSQVIQYACYFHNGTHVTELLKFIAKMPEISYIEYNIFIIAMEVSGYKHMGPGMLFFSGIKLVELGLKLRSTKIESIYFNKLQEIWGNIIVATCDKVQYKPVIFSKLIDLPSHLLEMEEKFNVKKFENYFLDILIPSLRRVLNKEGVETKLDMILSCVPKSFPLIEPGAILYSTVFDEITKQNLTNTNNFITKFAYYIKNYMELPNYSHIDEKYKEVFENLKRNIPDWAQKLIWNGGNCKLKNHKWNQYLVSACGKFGCNSTSKDSYLIFAEQIDNIQENADVQSQWKFETKNQGTSFTITNVGSDEFLYPDPNFDDENGRPVVNPRNTNVQPLWNITASGIGKFITLQNTHKNEYLSVGDPYKNDPLKRKLTTMKLGSPTQEIVQESEWKLICE